MAYLFYTSKADKYANVLVKPKDRSTFSDAELRCQIGNDYIVEQLASWMGEEYEFLKPCRFRWIAYSPDKSRCVNGDATKYAGHDIYGTALMCSDSEIDPSTNINLKPYSNVDK